MAPLARELSDRELLLDLHAKLSTVLDTVHRHERALAGNGQPGIGQRLTLQEERYATCQARLAASWQQQHGRWTLYLACLAILVSGVAAGISLWRTLGQ